MQQLVDSFRTRESFEAHLTKVAERNTVVQPSDQPICDRLRKQDFRSERLLNHFVRMQQTATVGW